ncbi:MAG: DUF2752 domain-containing protein [Isosphaeraceae bacterium]
MVSLALGLCLVFAVALWLDPDPNGFGTHTQLGLPPCHFMWVTGTKCPSCGMTTAFAWFVRGRLDRSWQANPAGVFIASGCLVLIPWLLAGAARGRPLGTRTLEAPLVGLVVAAVALSLLTWLIRLLLGRVL